MDKLGKFCKVPYTLINGRYRPYLEIIFHNPKINKSTSKTFAMVDSGADHTVIPFSMGKLIGLDDPNEAEVLANVSGVGGNLSYIQRDCNIYLTNQLKKEIYVFKETVWWIYPDKNTLDEQKRLIDEFTNFNNLQQQCKPDTELFKHFQIQQNLTIAKLSGISNKLETGILLGRPFFDNFEFIQFLHKDRNQEDKCYFNYKVKNSKIIETLPTQQSPSVNQVQVKIGAVGKKI